MIRSLYVPALLATLVLAGCERPAPVTIQVPVPVAVPGPAGPPGAPGEPGQQGNRGYDGSKGEAGKSGEGTTVIVVPPAASAPAS